MTKSNILNLLFPGRRKNLAALSRALLEAFGARLKRCRSPTGKRYLWIATGI